MARSRAGRRARRARPAAGGEQPAPGPPAPKTPPPVRPRRLARWLRWRPLTAAPAIALALLGIVGLATTVHTSSPPPPARDPVRYPSGPALAGRLVILQVPQLDERAILQLRGLLGAGDASAGALFAIGRPGFASFEEISLLLLAGNETADATPPPPGASDRSPDTLVRSMLGQGRGVALIGPESWRALFAASGAVNSGTPAPPKTEMLLTAATAALSAHQAELVVVHLRDLTARDLREDPGSTREALAALGASLDRRDALLLVGSGGLGEALHLSLSGAGTRPAPLRALALNDLAPTCAVLLGTAYPFEARGRVAWPLLDTDQARKAVATAALARQRMTLASTLVPFGVRYPAGLVNGLAHLVEIDDTVAAQQYTFAYQLAASSVDDADRLLGALASAAPVPPSRRAAWAVVVPCLVLALAATALALVRRSWGALVAALVGAVVTLMLWLSLAILLRRAIVPRLEILAGLTLLQALAGGFLAAWLYRQRLFADRPGEQPYRRGSATELLVLLAALPIAACAYRYGLPWRLRLDEATPLFRWRSALMAPIGLLLAGYTWAFLVPHRRPQAAPPAEQGAET